MAGKAQRQVVGGQTSYTWQNNPPLLRSVGSQRTEIILERTEALSTSVTTGVAGALNIQSYFVHPGSTEFSWLRNMSNAFAEWQLMKMEFTYVPSVPTTQIGSVAIALRPDYGDTFPGTLAEVQRYDGSVSGPVYAGTDGGLWVNQWGINYPNVVGLTVPDYMFKFDKSHRTYRVVSDATFNGLSNADKNQYSPCAFVVATAGTATSSTAVGTIFARYKVRLFGATPITLQA